MEKELVLERYGDFPVFLRDMDGECLVFHGGSGGTHRLGPEAAFIYQRLGRQDNLSIGSDQLLAEMHHAGFVEFDADSLEKILHVLQTLYLIKRS